MIRQKDKQMNDEQTEGKTVKSAEEHGQTYRWTSGQ